MLTGTGSVTGVAAGTLPFTRSPLAMLVKIAAWLLVIGGVALVDRTQAPSSGVAGVTERSN